MKLFSHSSYQIIYVENEHVDIYWCWCCRIDGAQAFAGLSASIPQSVDTSSDERVVFSKADNKLCVKIGNENWFGQRCGTLSDYRCICQHKHKATEAPSANLIDKQATTRKQKSKSSGATKCHRSTQLLTAIVIIVMDIACLFAHIVV